MCLPSTVLALTPIARTDVVPYQRIEYGTTFKFGVVAFSKAGIDRVDFTISGQGYNGGTKSSSSMTLNTRLAHTSTGEVAGHTGWPGVWEYYVEIASSEFTSNGAITVTPTVYGDDAGDKVLTAIPMIVEATEAYSHNECWVDIDGSDGTGTANNENDPFPSIESAVTACQTANSGSSDGNIVYLVADTYDSVGSATTTTTGEWITIMADDGASRDTVIINDGGSVFTTDFLKIKGLTLQSTGATDYVINETGSYLWADDCKILGPGRHTTSGYPIKANNLTYHSTGCYTYDVDRAYGNVDFARNVTIKQISEDGFQNGEFIVNVRLDDQDNEDTTPDCHHSDGYQQSGGGSNRVIYNFFGTDMHYQGMFIRTTSSASANFALVNVFVEMRDPARGGTNTGTCTGTVLTSGSLYCDSGDTLDWDHFLMWHCSFPYKEFNFYTASGVNDISNSSFIGNIFWELWDDTSHTSNEITKFEYGNGLGNEALYNHYKSANTELYGTCGYTYPNGGAGCPYFASKAMDSSNGRTTHTHGGLSHPEVLDLTDTTSYTDFGMPDDEDIIDLMPSNLTGIPADVWGDERDTTPDIGALEYQGTISLGTGLIGCGIAQ